MNIIEVRNLEKSFKVLNRREGLKGSFQDLFSRNYSEVKAVNNISMNIKEGEIVGYLGPNGAGKSTTIKMMTGVLEPTSGEIVVNGTIPYKNRKKHAQNIGIVFGQRTQLWWALPVIESFKILKEIYRVSDKDFNETMALFDDLVNISSLYSKPVRQMSLGQRTLCDILASFLHNPKVVFLDEPTIGLDVAIKEKIRILIKELNKKKKTTIILTTHDISDVEALCNRVIIIDKGTIVFDDELQKLNSMFGAYRTLKVNMNESKDEYYKEFSQSLRNEFKQATSMSIGEPKAGWLDITINQEEVSLLEILKFSMSRGNVKDVQVKEIQTESVIRKIYGGNDL